MLEGSVIALSTRLKHARESRGLTQDQVAAHFGWTRGVLAQFETGVRVPKLDVLLRLAEHYSRPLDWFCNIEAEPPSQADALLALYRADPSLETVDSLREPLMEAVGIARLGMQLESLLDRQLKSSPPVYGLAAPINKSEAVRQGELVAFQERMRVGLGNVPIPDVSDFINEQGVWATGTPLPNGCSGIFVQSKDLGTVVFVNNEHPKARKRFSYAHEYAHCLLDRNDAARLSTREDRDNLSEVRANAFAAEFLMPSSGVAAFMRDLDKGALSRQTLHVYSAAAENDDTSTETTRRPAPGSQTIVFQDIAELASHFGVSYQAAVYRLLNLGLLSRSEIKQRLQEEDAANAYLKIQGLFSELNDTPDVQNSQRDLRRHVTYLALEAYRMDKISEERFLEIGEELHHDTNSFLELAKLCQSSKENARNY